MLFMKGNAKEPRCGFSRQIVEILTKLNVEFKTFDILSDQEVREALKIYSSWPTYPQVISLYSASVTTFFLNCFVSY